MLWKVDLSFMYVTSAEKQRDAHVVINVELFGISTSRHGGLLSLILTKLQDHWANPVLRESLAIQRTLYLSIRLMFCAYWI